LHEQAKNSASLLWDHMHLSPHDVLQKLLTRSLTKKPLDTKQNWRYTSSCIFDLLQQLRIILVRSTYSNKRTAQVDKADVFDTCFPIATDIHIY